MENNSKKKHRDAFSNAAAKAFFLAAIIAACAGLTGCDREAPVVSGLDDVIELDCGTEFNLEDYLNEHAKITDETDDGTVKYHLSELEYTIECDDDAYDAETGDFNTEKYGNYDVDLTVKDESNNKTTFAFIPGAIIIRSGIWQRHPLKRELSRNLHSFCGLKMTSKF